MLGCAFERVIDRAGLRPAPEADPDHHGRPDRRRAADQRALGPGQIPLQLPATLRGSFLFGDAAVENYRLIAVLVGLAVFVAMLLVLNRTKIGLLIRAGVENTRDGRGARLPHPRLFVGVFVAGSALAGLGGVMWALYHE